MRGWLGMGLAVAVATAAGCRDEQRSELVQPGGVTSEQEQAQQQSEAYSHWDPSQGKLPPQRTTTGTGGSGAAGTEDEQEADPAHPGGLTEFGLSIPPAAEKQTGIVNGELAATSEEDIQVRTKDGQTLELQVPSDAMVVIEGAVAGVDELEQLAEGTPVRVVYSIQQGTSVVTAVEAQLEPGQAQPDSKQ